MIGQVRLAYFSLVELITVRDIWCRHNYFRPKYCRNNSYYKKLYVDLGIVDLSNVGANI